MRISVEQRKLTVGYHFLLNTGWTQQTQFPKAMSNLRRRITPILHEFDATLFWRMRCALWDV